MKTALFRIVRAIVFIEIVYLIVVNLVLNLSLTQTLINELKPERYTVNWERAWTWYPFRVNATKIFANGQTWSKQWQLQAPRASASISIVHLLNRTVYIRSLAATDVEFYVRPRPQPEKDDAEIREFFPPINGRDPNLAANPGERKTGRGWHIVVNDARARGDHTVWANQFRAVMAGDLAANIDFTTRGGPLEITDGEIDARMNSLRIQHHTIDAASGTVAGNFSMGPFVPAQHRGLKSLGFLTYDARVDLQVNGFDFLNYYLRRFNGVRVGGAGNVRGRLHYERGDLIEGSQLDFTASDLNLNINQYSVNGNGAININTNTDIADTLAIDMLFDTLDVVRGPEQEILCEGNKLRILLQGSNHVLLDMQDSTEHDKVDITIPELTVPNLEAYQQYLPKKWALELRDGSGTLAGRAHFSAHSLSTDLRLTSTGANLAYKEFDIISKLDVGLKANGGAVDAAVIDLRGTYFKLDDAKLTSDDQNHDKPWFASFSISEGTFGVPTTGDTSTRSGLIELTRSINGKGLSETLAGMDADFAAHLAVSDLDWINLLIKNPFNVKISGAGDVYVDLGVRMGWLEKGTAIRVMPRDLRIRTLDYITQGDGEVDLVVTRGGSSPDILLDAKVDGGSIKRSDSPDAVVEDVTFELTTEARDVTIGEKATVTTLDLQIPSARVTDMSVYNAFIPNTAPLTLLSGQAQLVADVHLEPESAGGYLRLKTKGLRTRLNDQELSGELNFNINLNGGTPNDMKYDISGSSLDLSEMTIAGSTENFEQTDWSAHVNFKKAQVVWKQPMSIDAEAELEMKNSRPIVAILANQKGKHGWIEKLMTVENIKGKAKFAMNSEAIVIPYAIAGGGKISVGAKGVIDEKSSEGVFFARYGKLKGILKINDDRSNFDIIGAQKKFDNYEPFAVPGSEQKK